jgi:arabinogalactan oligomer / maltooligosaccharide transport system substrate-binding protein
MKHLRFIILCLGLCVGISCRKAPVAKAPKIILRLWHTFNLEETVTLNTILARIQSDHPGWQVQTTVIPFARAQNEFRQAAQSCRPGAPDVFRSELPWVAEFVSNHLLQEVPPEAPAETLNLPQAVEAARYQGRRWALPANLDCLALFYHRDLVPHPPDTLEAFLSQAHTLTIDSDGHHPGEAAFNAAKTVRWGFYVRADAYWFLPFLWAEGGDMLDPRTKTIYIDQPPAIIALQRYRDLIQVDQIAPPRPSPSNDYEEQMRLFAVGEVAMMTNGPWAMSSLLQQQAFKDQTRLGIAPFPLGRSGKPAAPSSGHGFVVSSCTKAPAAAWQLAALLSDVTVQGEFAQVNSLLPAARAAYELPQVKKNPFIGQFRRALDHARSRPQHPAIARIFDDFNPAVQAVLLNDADPTAAFSALARSWRRLLQLSPRIDVPRP